MKRKGGFALDINETAAWVKRLQTGDDSAFDALFAAYQKQAVRTAALITGETSLAEDVAQEAFVSCLLHIKDLKEPTRFKPWFFRILTRCAWKAMEQKIPAVDWGEALEKVMPSAPDTYPSEKEAVYERLYQALDGLGKKQRTTIILYYFNDLSIREIAEATSSLEGTVKTRLFAAKRRLKRVLEADGQKGAEIYEI
ncbi:MAG: RNA polymerase sigma factor [Bacteroidales bacterium]|nr:RNA polymerase sigma factor [Anaerotignum sp.]MCI5680327.1 RNA polymerase sigma factor [Bacteroidales bacterium]MDY3926292.1 RNA polymerase sigma factor [Anaerotignum sp.]